VVVVAAIIAVMVMAAVPAKEKEIEVPVSPLMSIRHRKT
jgi:hypothetical protein